MWPSVNGFIELLLGPRSRVKAYWSSIITVVSEKVSSGMLEMQRGEVTSRAAMLYKLGPS